MGESNMKKFIKHKFNAIATTIDGIRYDSKKESRYAGELKMLQMAGEVVFYLRQIPFDIGGGLKFRLDFMVFFANGDIRFVEVKGYETKEWKIKKKLVEELYPIKIEVK